MPDVKGNLSKTYDLLKKGGLTNAKDLNDFTSKMSQSAYRGQVYGTLKKYNVSGIGNSFDEFNWLFGYNSAGKPLNTKAAGKTAGTVAKSTQQAQNVGQQMFGGSGSTAANMASGGNSWSGGVETPPNKTAAGAVTEPAGKAAGTVAAEGAKAQQAAGPIDLSRPEPMKVGTVADAMRERPAYSGDMDMLATAGAPRKNATSKLEQWNTARKSVHKDFDADVKTMTDKAIADADKAVADVWAEYLPAHSGIYANPEGESLAPSIKAGQQRDKILDGLQESFGKNILGFVEKNIDKISKSAEAAGMDLQEYVDKHVAPGLQENIAKQINDTLVKRAMPKGDAEYIMGSIGSWVQNLLYKALTGSRYQNAAEQEARQAYGENAGWGTRVAAGAVEFADPAFGAAFKTGGIVGKGVAKATGLSLLAEGAANKVFQKSAQYAAKFGTKAGARMDALLAQATAKGAGKHYIATLPAEIIGQGLGMNMYGALQGGVSTLGSTGDLEAAGATAWEALTDVNGFASGAAFATFMPLLHQGWNVLGAGYKKGAGALNKAGWIGARALYEAGSIMGTAAVMHLGHNLGSLAEGGDFDFTVNGVMEETAVAAAMKFNPHLLGAISNARKSGRWFGSEGGMFTKAERDEICSVTGAKNLDEALLSIFPDMMKPDGKPSGTVASAEEVGAAQTRFLQVMNSLSWDAQNKLAVALTGSFTVSRPRTASFSFDGDEVIEHDKDGKVLSRTTFKTEDEKQAYITEKNMQTKNADFFDVYGTALDKDKSKDKSATKTSLTDALGAMGVEYGEFEKAAGKEPMRRTQRDWDILDAARKALMETAYPEGEVHVEHSESEGARVAEEAGLTTDNPDVERVAELNARVDAAQDELAQTYKDYEWGADYEALKVQGLSDKDALAQLMEIYNEADLEPLAKAVNAQAAQDGFMTGVENQIEQKVSELVNMATSGVKRDMGLEMSGVVLLTDADGNQVVMLSGDLTGTEPIIVMGADGVPHPAKASDFNMGWQSISPEEFADMKREELGQKATAVIDPEGRLAEGAGAPAEAPQGTAESGAVETAANEGENSAGKPLNTNGGAEAAGETGENAAVETAANEGAETAGNAAGTVAGGVPVDENGNAMLTHESVKPAQSVEHIYNKSGLSKEEADAFVDDMVNESRAAADKLEKKQVKLKGSLEERAKTKREHVEAVKKAKTEAERWEAIRDEAHKFDVPEKSEQEVAEEDAIITSDYEGMMDSPEAIIAQNMPKITPEDYYRETGLKAGDRPAFWLAGKEKGGSTVDEAVLALREVLNGYNISENEIRDVVIDIISNGGPRSYLKRLRERMAEAKDAEERWELEQRDRAYYENYGMEYEEYRRYEESELSRVAELYRGVDENAIAAHHAAEWAAYDERRSGEDENVNENENGASENANERGRRNADERGNNENVNVNENLNENGRKDTGADGGNDVLPRAQVGNEGGNGEGTKSEGEGAASHKVQDKDGEVSGESQPLTAADENSAGEPLNTKPSGEAVAPGAAEQNSVAAEKPKKAWGSENKIITQEKHAQLLARLRAKTNQLRSGVDPEMLEIGTELAMYHVEAGARKFADYVKALVNDLREAGFGKEHLDKLKNEFKRWYGAAIMDENMMEFEEEFDDVREVRRMDVDEIIRELDSEGEPLNAKEGTAGESDATRRSVEEDAAPVETPLETKDNKPNKVTENGAERVQELADGSAEGRREGHGGNEDSSLGGGERHEDVGAESGRVEGRNGGDTVPDSLGSGRTAELGNGSESERDVKTEPAADAAGTGAGEAADPRTAERNGSAGESDATRRTEQGAEHAADAAEAPQGTKNSRNYRVGVDSAGKPLNTNDYSHKSPDARVKANIEAIRVMKELEESGAVATKEQMDKMARFSGWGGLGITKRKNEIIAAIGEDAYEQAALSANSSYYTPGEVVNTMWAIAEKLGFKGGRILEGSAGIGNMLAMMPEKISGRSDIHAVEIDGTTGGLLKQLYPDAKVDVQGFEKTKVENGSVDLAITNVPFVTGLKVHDDTGDKDLSKRFGNIHDFCIAKNVRKLKEGGIGIFISSSGTLDNSTELRRWLVNEGKADVIGAFRMHDETFGGTGATSDIIVIRKRNGNTVSNHAIDVSNVVGVRTVEIPTGKKDKDGKEKIANKTITINKYFAEHPENMGGEMKFGVEVDDTFRPESQRLVNDGSQEKKMQEWLEKVIPEANASGTVAGDGVETPTNKLSVEERVAKINEKLGAGVHEGSMVLNKKGELCVARRGEAVPLEGKSLSQKVKGKYTKQEVFKDYTGVKSALQELLDYQMNNEGDEGLAPLMTKLNRAYDGFVRKYGNITGNRSLSFLKNDADFANIMGLENAKDVYDAKGKKHTAISKGDIFKKRVVIKDSEPQPKNEKDGVIASIYKYGKIDTRFIAEKLGKSEEEVKKTILDEGLGFEDPTSGDTVVSFDYLSGNVREKLELARENNTDGKYDKNIKELEKVVPMDIPAHLIDFNLGSNWVEPKLFTDYIMEKTGLKTRLSNFNGSWSMAEGTHEDTLENRNAGVYSEMFNEHILGTKLIEAAMRNSTITVSHTYKIAGSSKTETDKEATQACQTKIGEIRADFREWAHDKMRNDPELAKRIEKTYNDKFNNYVPRQIPDSFVPERFAGQVTEMGGMTFGLRPHQSKAAIRATMEPVLLAHEVGTGKTFTQITTAMEMRRLGTAKKPMIVVQNATTGQFVASAKALYPGAKILTIDDTSKGEQGRKDFYAKIRYNDWDMIIVPQSVLDRMPDSYERQMQYISDKIDEKLRTLEAMKEDNGASGFALSGAQKEIDALEAELFDLTLRKNEKDDKRDAKIRQNVVSKMEELLDRDIDDVEDFDEMGIDALIVDEAHEYKHLGFATAMQRGVKGVDPSPSKKGQGLFLKCQAVLEKSGGKNVVFATGTPISNTAAETWTFMRYLMPKAKMEEAGIYYFDDFVRNFGNITQMLEFATSGKFKENTRFAGYVNLPELVRLWSSITDTVLSKDQPAVQKALPHTVEGGSKATQVTMPQSKQLRSIMTWVRKQLEAFDKMSGQEKKANSHIPLVMYGVAAKAAIDPRLVLNDASADVPSSKTNMVVKDVLGELEATKDYKGTTAIFCDSYQNKNSGFNIYEEIKRKLVEGGVPEAQIYIMKSGMTPKKKAEVFDKVNAGEIRVIMGSTQTLGVGVNIQERLQSIHNLDVPNRPMDYTQRVGRLVRQGNLHKVWDKKVKIWNYAVEDSLDITGYQRLQTKGNIADSIMNGGELMKNNQENRSIEEEEDSFGDVVANLSGSQFALLKQKAERDLRKFENKKKQWESDQTYIHYNLPRLEGQKQEAVERIADSKEKLAAIEERVPGGKVEKITVGKKEFAGIGAMEEFFKEQNKKVNETMTEVRKQAEGGLEQTSKSKLTVNIGGYEVEFTTVIKGDIGIGTQAASARRTMFMTCKELDIDGLSVKGGYLKNGIEEIINDVLSGADYREMIERAENSIKRYDKEIESLRAREGRPFEYEAELKDAEAKVEEYTERMKEEMAEKEKKYAEMDKEAGDVKLEDMDLSSGEDEDFDDAEGNNSGGSALSRRTRYSMMDGEGESEGAASVNHEQFNSDFEAIENELKTADSARKRELQQKKVELIKAYAESLGYPEAVVHSSLLRGAFKELGNGNIKSAATLGYAKLQELLFGGHISGFYTEGGGKVYAIAEHMKTGAKAIETLAHEDAHLGYSEGESRFVDALVGKLKSFEVKREELLDAIKRTGANMSAYNDLPYADLADEFLAHGVGRLEAGYDINEFTKNKDLQQLITENHAERRNARLQNRHGRGNLSGLQSNEGGNRQAGGNQSGASGNKRTRSASTLWGDGLESERRIKYSFLRKGDKNLSDDDKRAIDELEGDAQPWNGGRMDGRDSGNTAANIRAHVEKVGKGAQMHSDVADVPERFRKSAEDGRLKAWWDAKSGEVHLYMPNIRSRYEAEKAIVHETVGHKGMRGLLNTAENPDGFRKYMDMLWADKSNTALREFVKRYAPTHKWDIYEGIEEWIAREAEKEVSPESLSMWGKVKRVFTDALRKAGYLWNPNIADVRYALWLAKRGGGKGPFDPMWRAKKAAMRDKIMKGDYSPATKDGAYVSDAEAAANRDSAGKPLNTKVRASEDLTPMGKAVRAELDRRYKSRAFRYREAFHDSMEALRNAQEAIGGKDVKDAENAYLAENHITSIAEAQWNKFKVQKFQPLEEAINKCVGLFGGEAKTALKEIEGYMYKKHGLERNIYMYVRDYVNKYAKSKEGIEAEKNYKYMMEEGLSPDDMADMDRGNILTADAMWSKFMDEKSRLMRAYKNGEISYGEAIRELDEFVREEIDGEYEAEKVDYSGLSSLEGDAVETATNENGAQPSTAANKEDGSYDRDAIIDAVDDMEGMLGRERVDELWQRTNDATSFAVDYSYQSGQADSQGRDGILGMYDFYVPLRGFAEDKMEDIYDRYGNGNNVSNVGKVLKRAEGRKSMADSPLATISAMANAAITQGERNKMLQKFYRLVAKNPNDMVKVSEVWEVLPDTDAVETATHKEPAADAAGTVAEGEWRVVTPQFSEDASVMDIADAVDNFNLRMKMLEAQGLARKVQGRPKYPAGFLNKLNANQHAVRVYVNGREKVMWVTGDPRLAQALRGEIRHENHAVAPAKWLMNKTATFATSMSPEFILSNTSRDTLFSSANIASKESAGYFAKFTKNQAIAAGVMGFSGIGGDKVGESVFEKYYRGREPKDNIEKMFFEFMDNGGRTGFVAQQQLEQHKKELAASIKGTTVTAKTLDAAAAIGKMIPKSVEEMNMRAELINRFAVYMTSRQMGRSRMRSVADAKEVSVNFNRKGAGNATEGKFGSVAGFMRDYYMFFNAGMQSMELLYRNLSKDKSTAVKSFAYMGAVPAVIGLAFAQMMSGDDDEEYSKIPSWDRRNNICIPVKSKGYVKIPLPIELRAFWGMGDIMASIKNPRLQTEESPEFAMAGQISQMLPLDILEAGEGRFKKDTWWLPWLPTTMRPVGEMMKNIDWTGKPIQKDSKFNPDAPEWTLAYKSTPKPFVEFCKWAHDVTREGKETAQETDVTGLNLSPAKTEHLLKSYFSGLYSMTGKVIGAATADELDAARMPMVSRLWGSFTDKEADATTNAKYWAYKREAENTYKEFKNDANKTNPLAITELRESGRGRRTMIYKSYEKRIAEMQKLIDAEKDADMKRWMQQQLGMAKRELVDALDGVN